jgi:small subunit ribosomal protein S2
MPAKKKEVKEEKETKEIKKKSKKSKETKEIPEDKLKGEELEKAAEAESKKDSKEIKDLSLEERKKALLERAAKLKAEKTDSAKIDTEALKEEVKVKKKDMLIPLEEYVKTGIYLGTRVVTPDMRPFVYRRRADGLAIFNTDIIDEKIREGIEYLSQFRPEDVILVCKRQSCHKIAKKFEEVTGIRVFTKKYPAGILTNTELEDFFEPELTIITDHWLEKNALKDTRDVHKKVMMICGTNNFSRQADKVIIGNNKSPKSVGLIYYLLARGYLQSQDKDTSVLGDMDWWTEGEDE